MRDADCVTFLRWALPRMGLAWSGFRKVRRQVCRRIDRRRSALGLSDLPSYRRRLERDPGEWPILERLCRVTISRFFRDRGLWRSLEREILPTLAARLEARGARALRVWCAGCASGEEPYSVAILWRRRLADEHRRLALEIVATDIDLTLLARARRALYPQSSLGEAAALGLDDAFEALPTGELGLRLRYRQGVHFAALDLESEPPAGRFDLLFCRNLAFTYYDESRQRRALGRLASCLAPHGLLVLGCHERLPGPPPGSRSRGPCLFEIAPLES